MKRIVGTLVLIGLVATTVVQSLEHYNNFREGSCSRVRMKPIRNLNRRWIDTLEPYVPAGNKYHFYRIAAGHHRYREMKESEFFYDFCYQRNHSSTQYIGESIAFGRVMTTDDVILPRDPSVYLEINPHAQEHRGDILRQWITMTDNKSFVFVSMCWTGVNQRAWMVFSSRPTLDAPTERIITEHAVALGFRRENILFIRYDSCHIRNPLTNYQHNQQFQNNFPQNQFHNNNYPQNQQLHNNFHQNQHLHNSFPQNQQLHNNYPQNQHHNNYPHNQHHNNYPHNQHHNSFPQNQHFHNRYPQNHRFQSSYPHNQLHHNTHPQNQHHHNGYPQNTRFQNSFSQNQQHHNSYPQNHRLQNSFLQNQQHHNGYPQTQSHNNQQFQSSYPQNQQFQNSYSQNQQYPQSQQLQSSYPHFRQFIDARNFQSTTETKLHGSYLASSSKPGGSGKIKWEE